MASGREAARDGYRDDEVGATSPDEISIKGSPVVCSALLNQKRLQLQMKVEW
jgi:hypothetical protein